jgi:hypothetical protein
LNGIELATPLQGGLGRITLQLGKIKIKIKFFFMLLFNFIFHLLTDNSFVTYRLHGFFVQGTKESKKNAKKKRELPRWKDVAI